MAHAQNAIAEQDRPYQPFTPQAVPGENARLGLIALATDPATEPEWRRMIPDDDIALYVTRIPYSSNCTPEGLMAMAEGMTDAARLIDARLKVDVIAYSCTSGTVTIGYDNVTRRIRAAHPDIPCSTPITGAVEAFNRLQASKIGVVTPYTNAINATMENYLVNEGCELTGMTGFGLTIDREIASIPMKDLANAVADVLTDETEAIFFSCTALIIADHIDALEQRFGLPVVTSNQAMLWQSLRLAGYKKPIAGFGRLMTL